ncbi:MAG: hypothetical protein AAF499_06865, partial [Pseudomonadota bacterium]
MQGSQRRNRRLLLIAGGVLLCGVLVEGIAWWSAAQPDCADRDCARTSLSDVGTVPASTPASGALRVGAPSDAESGSPPVPEPLGEPEPLIFDEESEEPTDGEDELVEPPPPNEEEIDILALLNADDPTEAPDAEPDESDADTASESDSAGGDDSDADSGSGSGGFSSGAV